MYYGGDRGMFKGYLSGSQEGNQSMTVREALTMYLNRCADRARKKGFQEESLYGRRIRLEVFLGPVMGESLEVFAFRLKELIERYSDDYAAATTKRAIGDALAATKYWLREGLLAKDPWVQKDAVDALDDLPTPDYGKDQLDEDEALVFARHCHALAKDDPRGYAAAALVVLYLGLRSSELLRIAPCHLDAGGTKLKLLRGGVRTKSKSGVETLTLDPIPHQLLHRAARGLRRDERLFPFRREAFLDNVKKLTRYITPKTVCPQGLRGTWFSLSVDGGVADRLEQVKRQGGHSNLGVTRKHYLRPGIERTAVARAVAQKLKTGIEK